MCSCIDIRPRFTEQEKCNHCNSKHYHLPDLSLNFVHALSHLPHDPILSPSCSPFTLFRQRVFHSLVHVLSTPAPPPPPTLSFIPFLRTVSSLFPVAVHQHALFHCQDLLHLLNMFGGSCGPSFQCSQRPHFIFYVVGLEV